MALSNWDTLSLRLNGEPADGTYQSFISPTISVEIYKNWLHIGDQRAWNKKDSGFTKPYVGMIHKGEFSYKNIKIFAKRGPKSGVYVIVYELDFDDDRDEPIIDGMVGIGCYGYGDDTEKILKERGIEVPTGYESKSFVSGRDSKGEYQGVTFFFEGKKPREIKFYTEVDFSPWVGIEDSEIAYLKEYIGELVKENELPEDFGRIDFSRAERFNQGDAFMSGYIGVDTEKTKPGETSVPIFERMIKGAKS